MTNTLYVANKSRRIPGGPARALAVQQRGLISDGQGAMFIRVKIVDRTESAEGKAHLGESEKRASTKADESNVQTIVTIVPRYRLSQ